MARCSAPRVGAVDVPKIAKFYETVFGLKETNRLELPGLFEIMLNFGDSVDAARKNTNPMVVVDAPGLGFGQTTPRRTSSSPSGKTSRRRSPR